jgi:hypothetical protein
VTFRWQGIDIRKRSPLRELRTWAQRDCYSITERGSWSDEELKETRISGLIWNFTGLPGPGTNEQGLGIGSSGLTGTQVHIICILYRSCWNLSKYMCIPYYGSKYMSITY